MQARDLLMYFWAGIFAFIAFVTGIVAFTPVAASSYTEVAKVLFIAFIFLAVNALILAFTNHDR